MSAALQTINGRPRSVGCSIDRVMRTELCVLDSARDGAVAFGIGRGGFHRTFHDRFPSASS
jgi:hypothetical protein